MSKTDMPAGWDEERLRRVLKHYQSQTDEDAVAEDEAALNERRSRSADSVLSPLNKENLG